MPLRPPTATRTVSKLGLASGGSLSAGYANFRDVMTTPPPGEQASAEKTAENVARYGKLSEDAHLRALNAISQVQGRDKITDEQARAIAAGRQPHGGAGRRFIPLPAAGPQKETENLPAVVKQDLITDAGRIIPQWHVVRNLPAYLLEPIRIIGRQALNSFTRTDIEEIVMNSTLSNAEEEVRGLMKWITENGTYIRQPEKELMTFAGLFDHMDAEAYEANVKLFQVASQDFLLIRDNFGHYIYSWPTKDRVMNVGYHIEAHAPQQLLR